MATILVADDEEALRFLIETVLLRAGHQVVTVEDGLAALQAYKQSRFDLLLTDLQMPKMAGIAVIEKLVRSFPDARIIAMSAGGTGLLESASKAGAIATLPKPFHFVELVKLVDWAIAARTEVPRHKSAPILDHRTPRPIGSNTGIADLKNHIRNPRRSFGGK